MEDINVKEATQVITEPTMPARRGRKPSIKKNTPTKPVHTEETEPIRPKKIQEPIKKYVDGKINPAYVKQRDSQMVEGIFRFHEIPGGEMKFNYRSISGPIMEYALTDGQTYTLPFGLARHLRENCCYPVHKHSINKDGSPAVTIGRKVHRCTFEPTEFNVRQEIGEDASSDLVTVEYGKF